MAARRRAKKPVWEKKEHSTLKHIVIIAAILLLLIFLLLFFGGDSSHTPEGSEQIDLSNTSDDLNTNESAHSFDERSDVHSDEPQENDRQLDDEQEEFEDDRQNVGRERRQASSSPSNFDDEDNDDQDDENVLVLPPAEQCSLESTMRTAAFAECRDGVDNDGDLLIDFQDPQCAITGRESGDDLSHNFVFEFNDTTTLLQRLWWNGTLVIEDEGSMNQVPQAFIQHYLHSYAPPTSVSWKVIRANTTTQVRRQNITYTPLSSDNNTFSVRVTGPTLDIYDTYIFRGDTMYLVVNMTNTGKMRAKYEVPVNFGGLEIDPGNAEHIIPFISGYREPLRQFSTNLVGKSVTSGYMPASNMMDNTFTVGRQVLNYFSNPEYVDIQHQQFLRTKPAMPSIFHVELAPGESRQYVLAYSFAGPGQDDWQQTLQPFKEYHHGTFGTKTTYCPQGPFAYQVPIGQPNVWNNSVPKTDPASRFLPNTSFDDAFLGTYDYFNGAFPQFFNASIDIPLYGIWATAIRVYAIDKNGYPFNPRLDLTDPNLDFARNMTLLTQEIQDLEANGTNLVLYHYGCADVYGADIKYSPNGNTYAITRGKWAFPEDHRKNAVMQKHFDRLVPFFDAGVKAIYFDAPVCLNAHEYIEFVVDEYKQRYGRDLIAIAEGDSVYRMNFASLPHQKFVTGGVSTFFEGSLYHDFMDIKGEADYVGFVNDVLSAQDTMTMVRDHNYMPIFGTPYGNTNVDLSCEAYAAMARDWPQCGCGAPPQKPAYC